MKFKKGDKFNNPYLGNIKIMNAINIDGHKRYNIKHDKSVKRKGLSSSYLSSVSEEFLIVACKPQGEEQG